MPQSFVTSVVSMYLTAIASASVSKATNRPVLFRLEFQTELETTFWALTGKRLNIVGESENAFPITPNSSMFVQCQFPRGAFSLGVSV